jgi:hypothetical protein
MPSSTQTKISVLRKRHFAIIQATNDGVKGKYTDKYERVEQGPFWTDAARQKQLRHEIW